MLGVYLTPILDLSTTQWDLCYPYVPKYPQSKPGFDNIHITNTCDSVTSNALFIYQLMSVVFIYIYWKLHHENLQILKFTRLPQLTFLGTFR